MEILKKIHSFFIAIILITFLGIENRYKNVIVIESKSKETLDDKLDDLAQAEHDLEEENRRREEREKVRIKSI
jgi:hypothetical protein